MDKRVYYADAYPDPAAEALAGANYWRAAETGTDPWPPQDDAQMFDGLSPDGGPLVATDQARASRMPRTPLIIVFLWAVITGFSNAWLDVPHFLMGGAMLGAAILLMMYLGSLQPFTGLLSNWGGRLMLFYGFAAVLSSAASTPSLVAIRYVLVAVAFSIMISVCNAGMPNITAARWGLTWAGMAMAGAHLPAILLTGDVTDPKFRVALFLNPNAVGFIATITALSVLEAAVTRFRQGRLGLPFWVLVACVMASVLVLFGTKSRTAALALLAGFFVLMALRLRLWTAVMLSFVGTLILLIGWSTLGGMSAEVGRLYQVNVAGRDISTMTGRLQNWSNSIELLWAPSPWLGSGPGSSAPMVGVIHNAILYNLCEVGLVGTLPLIIILVLTSIAAVRRRRDTQMHFFIAAFAAGVVESIPEPTLFGVGNPGSLLFILATVVLLGWTGDKDGAPLPIPTNPGEWEADAAEYRY